MSRTMACGRLGNQIIRNVAVSLLAEKSDLHVLYSSHELISQLGIDLFCGTKTHHASMELTDANYKLVYDQPFITRHFGDIYAFFQTKEITSLIYEHLHSDHIKNKMIEKNPFRTRYQVNNDACVHIRLGDIAHFNPGLAYYQKTLSQLTFDKLYITTDQKDHDTIQQLISLYPNASIIEYDEIQTFQFASTCKHIILSHGSFSAIIGYLAYFSNVYYPEYESDKMWYGDMFSIPGWNKMSKI
jgi:transcriptional regulator